MTNYDPRAKKLESKNHIERIWNAIRIYNNHFISDKVRDRAFDVLEEEFSDYLDEEWVEDRREHWWEDNEINNSFGSWQHQQFRIDELVYSLTQK